MATFKQIREAISTTLEANIAGMKCYPLIPQNAFVLPATIVLPTDSDYAVAMGRGTDQYNFVLLVLVSYNHLESAQDNLDPFVAGSGEKSVRECIFLNRDLGYPNDINAHVGRMWDYGMRFSPDTQGRATEALGARLALTVYTRGTSE
jgi:hypothetical protein